jgi:hypothetical protein
VSGASVAATSPAWVLPVRPEDRFFLLFEGLGAPVVAMWGFLVEGGEPDPERLTAALEQALRRHPKAASRLVVGRPALGAELSWQAMDGCAPRACVFHPLRPRTGEEPDQEALTQILNRPLDPAVGPLVELHWIPHGPQRGTFAFRFHHALGDGHGSLALLRDVLQAYGGVPAPGEPLSASGPPLVPGSVWNRLRLFGRLLLFHFRRSLRYRFAPPAKLFDLRRKPGGAIRVAWRAFAPWKLARYRSASRAAGVTVNDLLLAAHGLAVERWMQERGLSCGTLRVMVNQNLRDRDAEPERVENRSAAFQVWIGPQDRRSGRDLLQRIHRQVQEAFGQRIAEATALLGAALRLPLALSRPMLLPAATRPRISDSLVLSNMGRLPGSGTDAGWLRLGHGRFVSGAAFVRPPEGVGALSLAMTFGETLRLTWCYFDSLFDPGEVDRCLELIEAALDELSA